MKTEVTGYWTFFCAPKTWEIDKFLASNRDRDTYQISKWHENEMQPGQLGVIRVGTDKRTKTELGTNKKLDIGIYAIVEILDRPTYKLSSSEFYLDKDLGKVKRLRVDIRYVKNLLSQPILFRELGQHKKVNLDKYLVPGFQSSSMPLKKEAFEEILEIAKVEEQILTVVEEKVIITVEQIEKLELKYRYAAPQVKEIISKRIERGSISKLVKKWYGDKCKICEALGNNPHSFQTRNGDFYVETHHINHVSSMEQGCLGLSNLITVCANHHRQLHYGNIEVRENTNGYLIIDIDGKLVTVEKKTLSLQVPNALSDNFPLTSAEAFDSLIRM
jgi:hypothetical protein